MKVNWTHKGRQRLQQLYDYIAEDQPANALHFIDQLTRRVEVLAVHPRSGKIVSKYQRDDIREIYEGRYRIIYRILPDRIDILTVRHIPSLVYARCAGQLKLFKIAPGDFVRIITT